MDAFITYEKTIHPTAGIQVSSTRKLNTTSEENQLRPIIKCKYSKVYDIILAFVLAHHSAAMLANF